MNDIFQDEECDNVSVNSLELSLQPDLKRSKRTMSRDAGVKIDHGTIRLHFKVLFSHLNLSNVPKALQGFLEK